LGILQQDVGIQKMLEKVVQERPAPGKWPIRKRHEGGRSYLSVMLTDVG